MAKRDDSFLGKRFDKLIAIKRHHRNKFNRWVIECVCDCGNKKYADLNDLKANKILSCGCYKKTKGPRKNIVGKKFGKLTVLEYAGKKNNKILWKCQCDCGSIKNINSTSLKSGATKSCGCLNHKHLNDLENKRFGRLVAINYVEIEGKKGFWKCKCDCGKNTIVNRTSLILGKTKSCGCLSEEKIINIIGKKFGKLLVLNFSHTIKKNKNKPRNYYKCRCDCGKISFVEKHNLISGAVSSCGCSNKIYRKDLSGNKIGKLTIIRRIQGGKHLYECRCECGRICYKDHSNLYMKTVKTCGNCGLIRNGKYTSWIALKLNDMVPNGQHNYYTGVKNDKKRNINVDIALVDKKIVIEYDGLIWHKDLYKDIRNSQRLIENGWKILRIRSKQKLPSREHIEKLLNILETSEQKLIIFQL